MGNNEPETQNPETQGSGEAPETQGSGTQDSEVQKQLALAPPAPMPPPAPRSDLDYALANDKSRPRGVRPAPEVPVAPEAEPGSFAWHLSNAVGDAYRNPKTAPLVNQPGGATKNLFLASTQALGAWQAALGNNDQTQPTAAPVQAPKPTVAHGIMERLGDISAAPGPGGFLGGFARTAKATTEREREQMKDRIQLAASNAQMLHEQTLAHKQGEDQIQAGVTSGKQGLDAVTSSGGIPVAEDKDSDELNQLIQQHTKDPSTGLDPSQNMIFLTGRRLVGNDANGQPMFRSTYTVVKAGGPVTLDEDQAKYINSQLHTDLKGGDNPQVLPAVQYYNMLQRAQSMEQVNATRKLALAEAGIKTEEANVKAGSLKIMSDPQVVGALAAAHAVGPNGQPIADPYALIKGYLALEANQPFMATHPNFRQEFAAANGGDDFKKLLEGYAKAQGKNSDTAKEMLDKAVADPKIMENAVPAYEASLNRIVSDSDASAEDKKNAAGLLGVVKDIKQGEIDLEKAKAEGKKEAATGYEGDQTATTPEAFLASLKPNERALVEGIGTNKISLERLDYLASRKPEVLDAVLRAFPDFISAKAKTYPEIYKNFTSTTGKTIGAQLLGGSAALKHLARLKQINDEDTVKARMGGASKAGAEYDNLLSTLADELGTFYNEPKTNEVIQSKIKSLGTLGNRDAAIQEQAKAMGERFNSMQDTWDNAPPSPSYRQPMPNVGIDAKRARAVLDPAYGAEHPEFLEPTPPRGHAGHIGKAADGTPVWPMNDGTIQDAKGNKYNPQTGKKF